MRIVLPILLCAGLLTALAAAPAMPPNPLTDAQAKSVLDSLDLARPELAKVSDARKRGDEAAARHAAADYFRQKTAARPLPPSRSPRRIADDAVAGRVTVVGIPHTFPDGVIDWSFNPTRAPGRDIDPEWLWQLNRMGFWPALGRAYRETKDEKYARAFVSQLRNWARTWPRPKDAASGMRSGWRTIECGIRLSGPWPAVFTDMAHSAELTDDDILLYFHCSLEQMRHLIRHCRRGNWLTMEMNGVYRFAVDHPEFAECAEARKFAVARLFEDLRKQFLPDGAQYELSPGYQFVSLSNSLQLLRNAEQAGFGAEIPAEYRAILRRGYAYLAKMMTPDRDLPKVNDSWGLDVTASFRRTAGLFDDDPLIAWVGRGAPVKPGETPDFNSCFLPWGGFAVFRENWNRDAHYLLFDVGPLGQAHCHQDKLNLVLYGFGEELLFDDGGGNYERSRYRQYALSGLDHSVIAVDGKPQTRANTPANRIAEKPIEAGFSTTKEADYAEGAYDDMFGKEAPAKHVRQVWYLKPDVFLVCDRLTAKDSQAHRYQARWQIDTLKMREEAPGLAGVLRSVREGKQADLVIAPLFAENVTVRWTSAEEKPEMRGMYVGRNPRPYRPAVTVTHEFAGPGEQLLVTLLCPVRAGSPALLKTVERTGPRSARAEFADGRVLSVTIPETGRPAWQWSGISVSRGNSSAGKNSQ